MERVRPRNAGDVEEVVKSVGEVMLTGTVERGHSIEVPDNSRQRVVGHTRPEDGGKIVCAPAVRRVMAGQTISLPKSEFLELQRLGYIIDPGKRLPDAQPGPEFVNAVSGPQASVVSARAT